MVNNPSEDKLLDNSSTSYQEDSFEEEEEYIDKDDINVDEGLKLPESTGKYDASEDIDEDDLLDNAFVFAKDIKKEKEVETKPNPEIKIEEKKQVQSTFKPFKETFSTEPKKEKTNSFSSFVENVTSDNNNKSTKGKKKDVVFTPFKESFAPSSTKKENVEKEIKTEEKVTSTIDNSEIINISSNNIGNSNNNVNITDINNISDTQLSELFKKKMLEVLFGSNAEVQQKEEVVDSEDNPDIELEDIPGSSTQNARGNKKRIKILEQTNVTYSGDSVGTPKCLPKGFRNTKYSKKTIGLMRIDFSSYIFLLCLLLVGGVAYLSYFIYTFSFEKYLRILSLSWLNIYSFMITPFAIGIFASILLRDIFKHIIAFYTGYKSLYFRIFGFTFYHYGKGTKKVGFSLKHLFNLRHEYVPKKDSTNKNPAIMNLLGGIGQIIFFIFLWVRYATYVNATDSRYLFWADQPQTVFVWMTFLTFLYALIPFIYHSIPLKMRSQSDAFNFFQLLGKNDRTCFNIVKINELREATGDDYMLAPISCNIQNYFQFYAYFYTYLSRLYNEDYKNARKDLHYLKQLNSVADKKDRYRVDFERSYIRYLYSDPADAEVIFSKVKKGSKKALRPKRLSEYRACIELCANILQESKRIIRFVEKLNTFLPYYPRIGKRIIKEYQFIAYSLKNVEKLIPNIQLPELSSIQSGSGSRRV